MLGEGHCNRWAYDLHVPAIMISATPPSQLCRHTHPRCPSPPNDVTTLIHFQHLLVIVAWPHPPTLGIHTHHATDHGERSPTHQSMQTHPPAPCTCT